MMKAILLAALAVSALAVGGCTEEERAEQRTLIEHKLPEGCKLYDLGEYAGISRLVAVICDDGGVTTTGRYRVGKVTRTFAVSAP